MNRNQKLLVTAVIVLCIGVIITGIVTRINKKKEIKNNDINVVFNQIYSSDYILNILDDNYYYGTYKDNQINVVIDKNGKEIYKTDKDVIYDNIYKTLSNEYIIYNNVDNNLNIYMFDGEKIYFYDNVDNVGTIKPILYKKDNIEYLLGFSLENTLEEQEVTSLSLYNLSTKTKKDITDYILVSDKYIDNKYYTRNQNSLIIKNNDNKYGAIDLELNQIIPCDYEDLINDFNNNYIALNNKNMYGIIDSNKEALIKFNYKMITPYEDYYLLFNNKVSILNKNLESIINDKKETIYFYHNDNIIYSYSNKNIITIYNSLLEEQRTITFDENKVIDNIVYVDDSTIEISYLEGSNIIKEQYDINGTKIETSKGKLVYKDSKYYLFYKTLEKNNKLEVIDKTGKEITSIEGNNIKVNNEYVIVDNSIYKIEIR